MKVRVKVKYLVLSMLFAVAFIPIYIYGVQPQVKLLFPEKSQEKEQILEVLAGSVPQSQKWKIIKKNMIEDGLSNRFDVYVGPSFTQVNTAYKSARFTWEEKLTYLVDYVENGPVDGYLANAATQLSIYYSKKGEMTKADQVLKEASFRMKELTQRYELKLQQARLALQVGDIKKAEVIASQLSSDENVGDYIKGQTTKLQAEIFLQKGEVEETLLQVEKEIQAYKAQMEKPDKDAKDESITSIALEQLERLHTHLQGIVDKQGTGMTTVTGKILRSDGTPVAGAGVFFTERGGR
jgi:hypothetical protein